MIDQEESLMLLAQEIRSQSIAITRLAESVERVIRIITETDEDTGEDEQPKAYLSGAPIR